MTIVPRLKVNRLSAADNCIAPDPLSTIKVPSPISATPADFSEHDAPPESLVKSPSIIPRAEIWGVQNRALARAKKNVESESRTIVTMNCSSALKKKVWLNRWS